MARRSEHTQQQIREMVLQASESVIRKEGLAALKVRRIAMEIGYTVGSVYMVFDNMDDLIMHIKANTLDHLAVQLDQALSNVDAEQDIQSLAKAYLQFANSQYNLWSTIFIHRLPDQSKVPEWYQNRVDNLFTRVENLFRKLSPHSNASEINQVARALWGGIHGICTLSLTGSMDVVGVKDVEASVLMLVDYFLYGWMISQSGRQS